MPDWSRRQTLQALTAGVATALAGCRSDDSTERTGPRYGRTVENYDVEQVRNEDGVALFGHGDPLPEEHLGAREVVTTDEELADLTFADVPEARTLREFATETEFDSASVYLLATGVEACYEIHLRRVSLEGGDPQVDFCRSLLPADVECDADATHSVAHAVRFPFSGEGFSGHGRGMSSTCDRPERPEPFDANVTLANGSGER